MEMKVCTIHSLSAIPYTSILYRDFLIFYVFHPEVQ